MPSPPTALDADWLGACRRATEGLRRILADNPTTAQRVVETGSRGEGGDRTLVIDSGAEDEVFAELEALHAQGHRFMAFSEERGRVEFGDTDGVRVIIDPIDGSLNAKRGVPSHAISVAVADGPTMADVAFAYVYDFGTREEWVARRGSGATCNGATLDPSAGERRNRAGKLELLAIESADPRWVAGRMEGLLEATHRLRAVGSIAITLCQVAAARFDAMCSLARSRGVDAAAGQLIVREAGGLVSFPWCESPLAQELDAEPRSPVVAARTEQGLAEVEAIVAR